MGLVGVSHGHPGIRLALDLIGRASGSGSSGCGSSGEMSAGTGREFRLLPCWFYCAPCRGEGGARTFCWGSWWTGGYFSRRRGYRRKNWKFEYLKPRRAPKTALLAPESHAKIASSYAPKGGKQSVRLYAVRLLGRWRCPLHPRYPAATQRAKARTSLSRHVWPRVPSLPPRSATVTAEEEKRAVGPCVATCGGPTVSGQNAETRPSTEKEFRRQDKGVMPLARHHSSLHRPATPFGDCEVVPL